MRLFCLYSSCYFGVRKVQLWILLKIVFHWNIQIEMWERFQNITFWRSLFPVRPRPSYPQRPLGSDQSPPRDVHRPETDVWLGISTKNIGGRFLARDFVVRTGDGGMGWGGRSGSRQRAGGIQGHCPPVTAKKGFPTSFGKSTRLSTVTWCCSDIYVLLETFFENIVLYQFVLGLKKEELFLVSSKGLTVLLPPPPQSD